jgi:hypothetical protein
MIVVKCFLMVEESCREFKLESNFLWVESNFLWVKKSSTSDVLFDTRVS